MRRLGYAALVVAAFVCGATGLPSVLAQTWTHNDASGWAQWASMTTAPSGTERGMVTRPIPSGVQTVTGPLTDTELRATAVPVSGTFWQGTQPVSGTFWQTTQPVSGTFWQTTQPVSGTFWQGTQPVSGPLTDAQLRATAVPVSGTFWQATQPVSGTVAATQSGTWSSRTLDGSGVSIGSGGNGTGITVTCTNCGGSVEATTYIVAVEASAAAASKDHLSMFNASGSGEVVRVLSVTINPDLAAAVTGLVQSFDLVRTSTTGTTCTAITIQKMDSANANVPAQITANNNCTTDPTTSFIVAGCAMDGEDARAAVATYGNCYTFRATGGQPWILREGEGLSVRSSALSGAWPVTVSMEVAWN